MGKRLDLSLHIWAPRAAYYLPSQKRTRMRTEDSVRRIAQGDFIMPRKRWECVHDIDGMKPAKELATPVTKFAPVSHRGCA